MSTCADPQAILGVSAGYHDSAAALLIDGELVGAAEEERFTRTKHDPSLPANAIRWCLEHGGVRSGDQLGVVFYDKPLTTWERIMMTHARVGPRGFPALQRALPLWVRSKLWVRYQLTRALKELGLSPARFEFAEHHQSHAAAAYYPSPFERAAILTFDGVGEWTTSSIAWGAGNRIEMKREQRFPDSLGLFYSAMTAYCGFEVNDGEYKLMGLAPFGSPRYTDTLLDRVIHIHDDGSVELDQQWFAYQQGDTMTHPRLGELLDGPPCDTGDTPGEREADLAASVQEVLERAVLATARYAHELTGERRACLAGGVSLNCVANSRLRDEGPFDEVWIQPAAGDAGSSIGAAYWGWHQLADRPRTPEPHSMSGAALGPAYHSDDIAQWLEHGAVSFERTTDLDRLCERTAADLASGLVVGWFRGRMEFGPRALGHRSILADPRDPAMVGRLNAAVKGRESFRPFAPAVMGEHADEWFDLGGRPSPFMLFTAAVTTDRRLPVEPGAGTSFSNQLSSPRSAIVACTHVDYSARVQTVASDEHPDFHALLSAFHRRTGVPVLLNTSFNRAGEPIVCSPADALACFDNAGLDVLVLEDCVVRRHEVARGAGTA